jgi:hypothetical protein
VAEIPPFKLEAVPQSDRASAVQGFEWAADDVGSRHRLGGTPDWLQDDETPACPTCGEKMTFYGQLDSIGDDVVLADCGMVYVFVCFNDFSTRSVLQSG